MHCSPLCRSIDRLMSEAENVCTAIGPTGKTSALWASAALLNDAVTGHLRLSRQIDRDALDMGLTSNQWRAVRDGAPGA